MDINLNNKEEIKNFLIENLNYEKKEAESISEEILSHDKKEDRKEILNELKEGGIQDFIREIDINFISAVEEPAEFSDFNIFKSLNKNGKFKMKRNILKEKNSDNDNVVFATVIIPNKKDREGDIITKEATKKAAHNFLEEKRNDKIDENHNLIAESGTLVESWILKEDRIFKNQKEEEIKYKEGTWIVGIKFEDDVYEKIENNEYEGLSLAGKAEEIVEINKNYKKKNNYNDKLISMEEEELIERFENLEKNIEKVNEKLEEKDEDNEDKEKQEIEVEDIGDVLDWLDENAPVEVVDIVQDAIQNEEEENEEEEEDNEEEEEEKDEEKETEETEKDEEKENNETEKDEEKETEEKDEKDKKIEELEKEIKELKEELKACRDNEDDENKDKNKSKDKIKYSRNTMIETNETNTSAKFKDYSDL